MFDVEVVVELRWRNWWTERERGYWGFVLFRLGEFHDTGDFHRLALNPAPIFTLNYISIF